MSLWRSRSQCFKRRLADSVPLLLVALFTLCSGPAEAGRAAVATGIVNDSTGKPLADATVFVYSAGVREGYSTLCPTCYLDCGKRVETDAAGKFAITSLDDQLIFNLLVVKAGYKPAWLRKVDPLNGSIPAVAIDVRPSLKDPQRVLRGKVVDEKDMDVPYALVEPQGITSIQDGYPVTSFGTRGTGDLLSVANSQGEIELVLGEPATNLLILVSARAKAPQLLNTGLGLDRKTFVVTDGATIRGRLLKDGKPLPNVELGLATVRRDMGAIYPEERIGTDEEGRFMFTNVPPGRVWDLSANMESLTDRDSLETVQCATERDGQDVNLGDLRLVKGLTLSGRVELTDGKPVPEGMHVYLSSTRITHVQSAVLAPDGSFTARGLLPGAYVLWPDVKGYRPRDGDFLEVLVKSDVDRFVIRLQPEVPDT